MTPDYIIKAAMEYKAKHGNSKAVYDAFIAGYKATRQTKAKNVELSDVQQEWFNRAWEAYGNKGSKGNSMKEWLNIPESDYPAILQHIEVYTSSRDRVFQKDFERYLKGKVYKNVVVKGNQVLYAPKVKKVIDKSKPEHERFAAWVEEYYPCISDTVMPTEEQYLEMKKLVDGEMVWACDMLQDDHHTGSLYDLFKERFGNNR